MGKKFKILEKSPEISEKGGSNGQEIQDTGKKVQKLV